MLLEGEEFYRISDDADEWTLLDIVSADEIVYILDEEAEPKQQPIDSSPTSPTSSQVEKRKCEKFIS